MGLGSEYNDIIHEIKQIRPLDSKQPWGIFWVSFKKKRLPVVMMRRILGHLVRKNKAKKSSATSAQWDLHDLLCISSYGEEHVRAITFAHFCQSPDRPEDLPVLRVLGWDDGDTILHLADVHEKLESNLSWPKNTSDLDSWRKKWAEAFTVGHLEVVRTTEEMVRELARLATAIRKRTGKSLDSESESGPMRKLYKSFKELLIHDLSEEDFTDVIAQTVTYGLLIARLSSESNITVQNMVEMVPPTNPFLRDLLGSFLHIAGRRKMFDFDELGIQDVVDLMNNANAEAIKNDFGNKTRGEDPVIHFYEHFLAAYNKKLKVQRGVFYTPQPVVSYIVRSVHELLQTEFGLEDGLASTVTWGEMLKKNPDLKLPPLTDEHNEKRTISPDEPFVQILDPATGTATFLVAVIDVIYNHLKKKWDKSGIKTLPVLPDDCRLKTDDCRLKTDDFSAYWNAYVPKALLPRLHGYELMMAPYAIAHMKIGLKLQETGYKFGSNERARIYLTNALEPKIHQLPQIGFDALAHEAAAVNEIKWYKKFTEIMTHMLSDINVALCFLRRSRENICSGIFVADKLIDKTILSSADNANVAPLFLYSDSDELNLGEKKRINYSPHFLEVLAQSLDLQQKGTFDLPVGLIPEDIFNYIYGVLHSPTYRTRYAEFLKIDFPRVPLTSSLDLFRELGRLGGELVSLHLMEFNVSEKVGSHRRGDRSSSDSSAPSHSTGQAICPYLRLTEFTGSKNPVVEKVSYSDSTVWIDKAKTIGFSGVPENVWNFHVGGYQVCEKWLKDRKERTLSAEDIQHYHKIVVALNETIRIMSEIDIVIEKHGGWPGAFNTQAKSESKPEKVMYFPKEESEFPLAAEKKDEYGNKE